jgi:putative ABC transport system substrate-binding protein
MQRTQHAHYKIRKMWTILVGVIVVTLVLSGCGATATKVYRVGILSGLDFFASTADGFKAKMTELGYVEGQNIVYDVQKTNFDMPAYKRILQKFVADKADLIFVFPTEASLEAKAATQGTNIPVVFANAGIEGVDLVKSVLEPGGNITGVRFPGSDLTLKRFEILRELAPQAKRIWIAYQQGYPIVAPELKVLRPAAAAAGVMLVEVPASSIADVEADLQTRAQSADIGMDAMLLMPEPLLVAPDAFTVVGKFAAEHKLPIGGATISLGDYNSAFGVSTDNIAVGKQAAILADKILKGTSAGTLPVVSAENVLQINYKAAQAQGLNVSDGLLRQAAQVVR